MTQSPPSVPLRAVLLDTGPLELLANPKASNEALACRTWVSRLTNDGVRVIVPEIADYELRRELILVSLTRSLHTLDQLHSLVEYLPLTTDTMRQAAVFWAQVRQAGRPTADRHALDGDAILAAQAASLGYTSGEAVVATTNVGHLSQFVTARLWSEISL